MSLGLISILLGIGILFWMRKDELPTSKWIRSRRSRPVAFHWRIWAGSSPSSVVSRGLSTRHCQNGDPVGGVLQLTEYAASVRSQVSGSVHHASITILTACSVSSALLLRRWHVRACIFLTMTVKTYIPTLTCRSILRKVEINN